MNIKAELGADRKQVIPQPRYMPRIPCCRQRATPSFQKVRFSCWPPSGMVCMRDLIVSAGKKRKLYDTPAEAPAMDCCHSGSGFDRISSLSRSELAAPAATL